jgi:hypothetical protein
MAFIEVEGEGGSHTLVNVDHITRIVIQREGEDAVVNLVLPATKITLKGPPATRLIQQFRKIVTHAFVSDR